MNSQTKIRNTNTPVTQENQDLSKNQNKSAQANSLFRTQAKHEGYKTKSVEANRSENGAKPGKVKDLIQTYSNSPANSGNSTPYSSSRAQALNQQPKRTIAANAPTGAQSGNAFKQAPVSKNNNTVSEKVEPTGPHTTEPLQDRDQFITNAYSKQINNLLLSIKEHLISTPSPVLTDKLQSLQVVIKKFHTLYPHIKAFEPASPELVMEVLAKAINSKNEKFAEFLIANGGNIEARNKDGQTLLMSAAKVQSSKYSKLLLDRGANIEARDGEGRTPLMHAAKAQSSQCVKLLLDSGANIEARDHEGRTPLMHAARGGITRGIAGPRADNPETLKMFLNAKAHVSATDKAGKTALMYSIESDHLDSTDFVTVFLQNIINESIQDPSIIPVLTQASKLARELNKPNNEKLILDCIQIRRSKAAEVFGKHSKKT